MASFSVMVKGKTQLLPLTPATDWVTHVVDSGTVLIYANWEIVLAVNTTFDPPAKLE